MLVVFFNFLILFKGIEIEENICCFEIEWLNCVLGVGVRILLIWLVLRIIWVKFWVVFVKLGILVISLMGCI